MGLQSRQSRAREGAGGIVGEIPIPISAPTYPESKKDEDMEIIHIYTNHTPEKSLRVNELIDFRISHLARSVSAWKKTFPAHLYAKRRVSACVHTFAPNMQRVFTKTRKVKTVKRIVIIHDFTPLVHTCRFVKKRFPQWITSRAATPFAIFQHITYTIIPQQLIPSTTRLMNKRKTSSTAPWPTKISTTASDPRSKYEYLPQP